MLEREVFVISDRTGITAETLSHSLLSQFSGVRFTTVVLPFVDNEEKLEEAVERINESAARCGVQPLIFSTFVKDYHRERLSRANGVVFDFFDRFIAPLERELATTSSHSLGQTHGMVDIKRYTSRIAAVNYSVHCDDGVNVKDYDQADVILVGVSRSGKTPTCLYLALHFGIFAANYPLLDEDLEGGRFPKVLTPYREKIYCLTIEPERLHQIRTERRPDSRYASLDQCRFEVSTFRELLRREQTPHADATAMSIEEISAIILQAKGLKRDLY